MERTRVVICGAAGRMGQALVRLAAGSDTLVLAGATERAGALVLGRDAGDVAGIGPVGVPIVDDVAPLCAPGVVLIDFTFHESVPVHARAAAAAGCGLVLGTTGLAPEEAAAVHEAARSIAVVWAPNMSVGVNLLFALVERAARVLGADYDVEIVEAHHRHKKDAPSGTALRLAEKVAASRGVDLAAVANYGREGQVGARPRGEIGIHSVRLGDVVGDHTVSFGTDGERVELGHRASSRDAFARGALHAARWLAGRPAGLYDMQAVLGLQDG